MLPDVRRLNKEDFQDAPNWVDPMLNTLNQFMDSVYNLMNKNLSLTENFNIQIVNISVNTDGNGDISPVKQKLSIRGKVQGVSVIRVIKESSDTTSIDAPYVEWVQSENILSILNIAGLNTSKKYKILLMVIGQQ